MILTFPRKRPHDEDPSVPAERFFIGLSSDPLKFSLSETTGSLSAAWAALLEQTKKKSALRASIAQNLISELKSKLDLSEKETTITADRCVKYCKSLQASARWMVDGRVDSRDAWDAARV